MSRLLPYFRWYPRDAESDPTYRKMTLLERGLYHSCLNHSWTEGGIPLTAEEIAEELGQPLRDVEKAWPKVSRRFVLDETIGRKVDPRQEEEREYARSKSSKAADAVRSRYGRNTDVDRPLYERSPRAYGSGSVSGSVSEKKEIPSESVGSARDAVRAMQQTLKPGDWDHGELFRQCFMRHNKDRAGQPLEVVARVMIGRNGSIDWKRMADVHPRYCEYWDRHDWTKNPLSFLEWVDAGMKEPPAEAETEAELRIRKKRERLLED